MVIYALGLVLVYNRSTYIVKAIVVTIINYYRNMFKVAATGLLDFTAARIIKLFGRNLHH